MDTDSQRVYLSPAEYIDSEHPLVREAAAGMASAAAPPSDRARAFFYAVRDDVTYGLPGGRSAAPPHESIADYFRDLATYRASSTLQRGYGYCVSKASLYAALCRASGLPARIAFADVRNHLSNARLRRSMGTDLFAWHGYAETLLDGTWVKVTPTFDKDLCNRIGVPPLEFDGVHDALLQAYDRAGRTYLTYLRHHGSFHDVPAQFLSAEMPRLYPGLESEPHRGRAYA